MESVHLGYTAGRQEEMLHALFMPWHGRHGKTMLLKMCHAKKPKYKLLLLRGPSFSSRSFLSETGEVEREAGEGGRVRA